MADTGEFYIDYSNLDDFQRQLIDRKNNKSMVVKGSAGSGKSLIALHKAKQLSTQGSYSVIVFTKSLREYFNDGLQQLKLSNVYHYHNWLKNKSHVKYMIVDECQDFSHNEIEEIKKYGDICFFFGDSAQSIMGFRGSVQTVEESAHSLGIDAERLYFNYRLTKEVAALANKVANFDDDELISSCKRNGEKPYLLEADDFDKQLDKIAETIQNRSLTNVGILLPFNTKQSAGHRENLPHLSVEYVKNYLIAKGVTCEFMYNANMSTDMDLDFQSNNPKVMTYWCAKGLQFKDVFVPGCNYDFLDDKRNAIYVAITRCCERLYLAYTGQLNGGIFPPEADSVYNKTNDFEIAF